MNQMKMMIIKKRKMMKLRKKLKYLMMKIV